MIQYKCVAAGCPFPEEIYGQKLRRPPACNLGHCRLEPVDVSQADATTSEAQPAAPEPTPAESGPAADEARPAVFDFMDATEPPQTEAMAVLIVGERRFVLPNACILGRQGDVASEAFGNDRTVSRIHARLTVDAQLAYLENIAQRGKALNELTVNDVSVAVGAGCALKPGRNRVRFGPAFTCEIELRR
jgi:hypothetical protein